MLEISIVNWNAVKNPHHQTLLPYSTLLFNETVDLIKQQGISITQEEFVDLRTAVDFVLDFKSGLQPETVERLKTLLVKLDVLGGVKKREVGNE